MLPQGFTRVEYIESTGTQKINTNVIPDASTVLDITFECKSGATTEHAIFGASWSINGFFLLAYSAAKGLRWHTGGKSVDVPVSNMLAKHRVICSTTSIAVDGTQYTVNATQADEAYPIELFSVYHNDGNYGNKGVYRLYPTTIQQGGTLVRDFIPCRNPDGEAGLYDMVGGQFYGNDGTGEFVCGRAVEFPEHYKRLAYIESTGTQYIDTGFTPNQNTRIVMDAIPMSVGGASGDCGMFFGSGYPVQQKGFEAYAFVGMVTGVYNGVQKDGSAVSAGQRVVVDFNKNVCNITADGKVVLNHTFAAATFTSAVSLALFVLPRQSRYYGRVQMHRCQIYDNGTLVRDYIPCQTDTGEVGLYDMETATFYGNAGTGEFVAGGVIAGEDVPDVPEALEYTLAGNIVALTWSASSGAETYRVYRDGTLIVETEATEYTDTVAESPAAHLYAVTAINEFGESALSESVRADIWGDTAPELIYDRTQADVDDAKALISKYMRGEALDSYEQELWERGLRGCYNTSDVNRVEYHTRELQNILNANGYNIHIDTRLWAKPDIMRYSDIVRYLGNINAILDAFGRSANAPKLPGIDRWIDYIAANDIEKILYVTRELIYGALAMFRRAGTFRAGGDYLAQVIRRA